MDGNPVADNRGQSEGEGGRSDPFQWLDGMDFNRFHVILLLFAVTAAMGAGYNVQIVSYALPFLLKEWQLTGVEAGALLSYAFLGLMFGAIGFGIASDHWGRKGPLIVAVALLSVFGGAVYFASDFRVFSFFRVLAGIGIGGILPLVVALLSEYAPARHRAKVLTLAGAGYTLGWALAGSAATFMIPFFGWRSVFLVGFLPLAIIPFAWLFLPESVRFYAGKKRYGDAATQLRKISRLSRLPRPDWAAESVRVPDGKEERGGFKDLFHPRLLVMTILMWLTYLFSMTVVYGLSTWLPSLFVRAGFSLSQSYSFGIIQALGATLGGYLLGWFMDRYGRKQTLAAMYLLGGCSVLLFGFASSAAGLYAAGLATGMLVFAAPTLLNVVCGETYPTSIRATGLGWANAAGRIGSVVGPLLGGMLHGKEGGPTPFFVVFSVPAFVCALFVLLYRVNARGQSLEEASEALQTPNGKD